MKNKLLLFGCWLFDIFCLAILGFVQFVFVMTGVLFYVMDILYWEVMVCLIVACEIVFLDCVRCQVRRLPGKMLLQCVRKAGKG